MNQNTATPAPATSATPTAEPTAATEPTPQIVENRDLAAAVPATAAEPEPTAPFRRTTRQFDLGDGRRLVDMRTTSGEVEIIPEAPGVNFGGLPTMGRDDAIRAALDLDGSDAERLALIRQIVETPDAANVRQIATATH